MTRSHFSAAVLLALAAGVTGCCSGTPHIVQKDANTCVVHVDQSSWCQWYYRREAVALIREQYDPNFKDKNIVNERVVDMRANGPDGKPLKPTKEYEIVYVKPTATMYGMTSGTQPMMPNGALGGPVVPAGANVMQPPGAMMPPPNPGFGGQPLPANPGFGNPATPNYQQPPSMPGFPPSPGAQAPTGFGNSH